ncbi:MAG: hypothetical protein ABIF82_12750 [Planctomycetota bacterium]
MDFNVKGRNAGPSPYRGIVWAVVLGAALIIIYGMSVYKPRPREEPAPPGQPNRGETTAPAKAEKAAVAATLEGEPEGAAPELPAYLTDPDTLKEAAHSSAALDTFSFYYLLYQLKISDVAKLEEDAVPAPGPEGMANWQPGKAVSLEGTVGLMEKRADLSIPDVNILAATQYEIRDARGQRYLVFTVYEMKGVEAGDKVNLVGRYLRLYAEPKAEKDKDGQIVPTPVIIAREVDGSRYLNDPSCLAEIRDGALGHEAKPFYYLANGVRRLTQDELKAGAEPELTPVELARSPAFARGRIVVIDGSVILTQTVEDSPNIAGIDRFYWTILRTRERVPVWVYTLEEPKGIQKRDPVRVFGVFMKSRQYRSKQGFEEAALIVIGRRLLRLEATKSHSLALIVLVGGAVIAILLVIVVVWDRRTSRQFGRHVHTLAARGRPQNIDAIARDVASRARQAKDKPRGKPKDDAG